MNTDKHPEFASPDGDRMDVCSDAADVKTQEEEGEREDSSYSENGMFVEGGMDLCAIKTEAEEMEDNEQYLKTEKERQIVPKEEAEGASEDGMEDGLDEERTEDEDDEERDGDGDEEGDTLNEPQDLSLVDYSRYDSATLQDAHAAAEAAEGTCVPGDMGPRIQTTGKLNCDICGLSCVSINVLLVHKRSHTGERPFHCSQCGASFTQKGNLLRHIKLHSGEKPFKCPMCSYACRRRDALSGHLRTHSVEKPFKCNHCSRSYKQRSSLEEHRERCHVYIQSKGPAERAEDSHTSRTQMGTERALLLDRLASNVAKRKSSMPQKFTGIEGRAVASNLHTSQNGLHCPQFSTRFVSWVDKSFNMRTTGSERSHFCNRRERERENRHVARNVSRCLSVCSSVALCIRGLRLRRLLPLSPLSSSNFCCWLRMLFGPVNVVCSSSWCDNGVCLDLSFNRELVHQTDAKDPPGGSPGPDGQHQQHPILTGPDGDAAPSHRPYPISLSRNDINPLGLTNGHKIGMSLMGHPRNAQPPLCMDSFHNDSSQMSQPVMYSLGHLLGGLNHQNGVPHPHAQPIPLSHPLDALRVARAEGEAGPGAVYPCSHCRVIFLDYVMFTIHMGCHGFRDPLECNVCGHRSQDRYEFSSHIARGEHRLELK